MSLARQLMSGVTLEGIEINPNRYTHDEGAFNIAVESLEDLHEIFTESFYDMEQIDLAAIHEGVVIEGSQYETVIEAKGSSVVEKVKAFFLKLKEKVKAFLHAIKRHFDSLIKSGRDFAKTYKEDIQNLNFKDYKIKIHKYDDAAIKNIDVSEQEKTVKEAQDKLKKAMNDKTGSFGDDEQARTNVGSTYGSVKQKLEDSSLDKDYVEKQIVRTLSNGKCTDSEEFDKWVYGHFRNGETSKEDITEREVTSTEIKDMMNELISSKSPDDVEKIVKSTDKVYNEAIKTCNDAKNIIDKKKGTESGGTYYSDLSTLLTKYSECVSTTQTYVNKYVKGWKNAVSSRDSDYKGVIRGAFGYNRSYNKKNK